jgi:hypothetical protein
MRLYGCEMSRTMGRQGALKHSGNHLGFSLSFSPGRCLVDVNRDCPDVADRTQQKLSASVNHWRKDRRQPFVPEPNGLSDTNGKAHNH